MARGLRQFLSVVRAGLGRGRSSIWGICGPQFQGELGIRLHCGSASQRWLCWLAVGVLSTLNALGATTVAPDNSLLFAADSPENQYVRFGTPPAASGGAPGQAQRVDVHAGDVVLPHGERHDDDHQRQPAGRLQNAVPLIAKAAARSSQHNRRHQLHVRHRRRDGQARRGLRGMPTPAHRQQPLDRRPDDDHGQRLASRRGHLRRHNVEALPRRQARQRR